jgi:hypothetical protein
MNSDCALHWQFERLFRKTLQGSSAN